MNEDREKYNKYITKINAILASESFYVGFCKKLKAAKPIIKLNTKIRKKVFDVEWINIIEETLPNLDNIVRNPRKFIVIEEDIVDISLARAISTESVKHLAQHTNLISSVDKDGMVTPNKILNTTKEESYEIYENRFIYTLIKNVSNFIKKRLDTIQAAYVNDHILELDVDTSLFTGKTRVFYKLEMIASLPIDEVKAIPNEELNILERISKMQRIVAEFMGSPFAKQMVNSSPVRPPITRTNVILKNTDFKKALILWQFVESYSKIGFNVENDITKMPVDDLLNTNISDTICMGTLLMEGLVEGNVEDKGFFSESNIDELDLKEKEIEKTEETPDESEKESKEEKQETEACDDQLADDNGGKDGKNEQEESEKDEESGETPQCPSKKKEDDNEDDDVDAQDNTEVLAETRNLFQRTQDDSTLTKSEIAKINKAIDRVLLEFRLKTTQSKTVEMTENIQKNQISTDLIIRQLRKEMEAIKRSIDQKTKIIEKERFALEKSVENERNRMKTLEANLEKALEGKLDEIGLEIQEKSQLNLNNIEYASAEEIERLEAKSGDIIKELEKFSKEKEAKIDAENLAIAQKKEIE